MISLLLKKYLGSWKYPVIQRILSSLKKSCRLTNSKFLSIKKLRGKTLRKSKSDSLTIKENTRFTRNGKDWNKLLSTNLRQKLPSSNLRRYLLSNQNPKWQSRINWDPLSNAKLLPAAYWNIWFPSPPLSSTTIFWLLGLPIKIKPPKYIRLKEYSPHILLKSSQVGMWPIELDWRC